MAGDMRAHCEEDEVGARSLSVEGPACLAASPTCLHACHRRASSSSPLRPQTAPHASSLQGKLFTEELLEKRGVNWTSVRPVYIYVSGGVVVRGWVDGRGKTKPPNSLLLLSPEAAGITPPQAKQEEACC